MDLACLVSMVDQALREERDGLVHQVDLVLLAVRALEVPQADLVHRAQLDQ